MSMVTICASSRPILYRFPSGSMGLNLAFQFSDKTLKSSYVFTFYTIIAIITLCREILDNVPAHLEQCTVQYNTKINTFIIETFP